MSSDLRLNLMLGPRPFPVKSSGSLVSLPVTSQKALQANSPELTGENVTVILHLPPGHSSPSYSKTKTAKKSLYLT